MAQRSDSIPHSYGLRQERGLTTGKGRTKVSLTAYGLGDDIVVSIYNENAHIGAVAIGEYDYANQRVSTSVITRLGHKDDTVALKAAYLISRTTKKTTCVVAGIHLDDISKVEIDRLVKNSNKLVSVLISDRTDIVGIRKER